MRPYNPQTDQQQFVLNRSIPVITADGKISHQRRPGWWKPATCEEDKCPHWEFGWYTVIDPSTSFGQAQATYIRKSSGRRFREEADPTPGLLRFIFEPGQKCFRTHQVPVERDPRFLNVKDHQERQLDYDEWFDTFNEVSAKVAQARKEG